MVLRRKILPCKKPEFFEGLKIIKLNLFYNTRLL